MQKEIAVESLDWDKQFVLYNTLNQIFDTTRFPSNFPSKKTFNVHKVDENNIIKKQSTK